MAKQWLGIGAASVDNDNYAGKTFNGEIVRARVYDKALYADEIKQMYHKSLYAGAPKQLAISKVSFRTPCKVAPGNRYHVYGEGFQSGDSLVFRYPEGEEAFRLETVFNGTDGVSAVLPATLDGGQYQMSVCRDSSEMLLGSVVLTLSDTPDLQVKTGILAHRCVHGNGIPENSLAGLRKTREMGLYGAEFDVWVTTPEEGVDDGVVVVNHDKSYEGKSMEKSTYSQIGHLTLSNGEKLPTLDSFLEEGKDGQVHLTFEIKRHSDPENSRRCADEVLKLIEKHGYTRDMFTITSFDYDNLLYLRSKVGKDKLHLAYHGSKSPDELAADGIDGLAYTMSVFTAHPEWIARAHELGMSTTTWTPSTVEDFTTFIGLEVGSVTVNNVEAAARYLGRPYLTAE
jgi:glycerophosphoryl diester phosphodiesterase